MAAEEILWCVNVTGPDDVIATASRQEAISASMWFNQWWITNIADKGLSPDDPTMWAIPARWPWSAESHAEDVAKRKPDFEAMFSASIP